MPTDPAPELPGAHRHHGRAVVVIGDGAREDLRATAAVADAAVARAAKAWGRAARAPVIVLRPRDARSLAAVTGSSGSLSDVPALTVREGVGAGSGSRIIVNPDVWRTLTPRGRLVVLTHEVTHVLIADARSTQGGLGAADSGSAGPSSPGAGPPAWVSEGTAELIAYDGLGLAEEVIAAPLVREVRSGRAIPARPDALALSHGPQRPVAYAAARLAVMEVRERAGMPGVRRLVRGTASLERITGLTTEAFDDAWRARVTRLARSGGR